jgi:hypothetical protein
MEPTMKMLVKLAHDECFLVSEATAKRLQHSLPPDRYVTVIPVKEPGPSTPPTRGTAGTAATGPGSDSRGPSSAIVTSTSP